MNTVSDSSPLIGLTAIGRLELLRTLFQDIVVPPAVAAEIQRFALPAWIRVVPLPRSGPSPVIRSDLGPGETEAIALAVHLNTIEDEAVRIVLDDAAARSAAKQLGLRVIGVLGILSRAKECGLITVVRPELRALADAGFHISPAFQRDFLVRAGEIWFGKIALTATLDCKEA